MKTQKFENWYEKFTKLLKDKYGFTENAISTMDKQSYKETYFDDKYTVEDAVKEEISNLV